MKKSIRFIINPNSGIRWKTRIPVLIEKTFDSENFNVDIVFTEYPGHAIVLSKEACETGFDTVVAIGGDGSVNEVANPLVGTNTKLGIIPHGSGNGFANHLKISKNTRKALHLLKAGHTKQIDVCKCNDRFFFSNFGVGFDVHVAKQFSSHKIRGFLSYTVAVLIQFYLKYKPIEVILENGDKRIRKDVFLLSIFNSNQYGFGVGLAPESSLVDGVFNVCEVAPFGKLKLLWNGLSILMKKGNWVSELKKHTSKSFKIINLRKEKLIYQLDGDVHTTYDNLEISLQKSKLQVICPKNINL